MNFCTISFIVLAAAVAIKANIQVIVFELNPGLMKQHGTGSKSNAPSPRGVLPPSFYDQMDKVKSMGIVTSMLHGQGGTALISYNGKNVMFRNGAKTVCTGGATVYSNNIICNGKQSPAVNDICEPGAKGMVQMGDQICIWSRRNHNVNINATQQINNSIIVEPWPWSGWDRQSVQVNVDGGMTINGQKGCPSTGSFTTQTLKDKCGNALSDKYATVTYVPDPAQYNAVILPNRNKHLGCDDPNAKVCVFHVDITGQQGRKRAKLF